MRRRGDSAAVRALVWCHRWLGVVTCLLFALWFASGAVLLFVPFPSLPRVEALVMGEAVDLPSVRIAPDQALALAGAGTALRLRQRAGTPIYVVDGDAGLTVLDARTGRRAGLLTPGDAARIVFGRDRAVVRQVVGPFRYDQWIVHNQFDPLRPFFRVDLADSAGTQFYVSARTGDIVQRTTRWQRGWNWPGAVLHWAYLTPLRSSFTGWDRTVWTVSLIALLAATAGMVLGVQRTLAVRRAGVRRLTWFRARWPRWHHLGGLFIGVFVLSWMLSGWLSMDHGRLFSRGRPTPVQARAYAGLALRDAAASFPLDQLAHLPLAREIRFDAIAGVPLLAVVGATGQTTAYTGDITPMSAAKLDALAARAVARAWPAASPPLLPARVAPDDLYLLAEGLPSSALRINGAAGRPPVYVDGDDGRLLTVMDSSRAAYAWIYYGLHSFNFPDLARHPWLRYGVVLVLLLGGFLFSLTGVVLGWKRLRRAAQ